MSSSSVFPLEFCLVASQFSGAMYKSMGILFLTPADETDKYIWDLPSLLIYSLL